MQCIFSSVSLLIIPPIVIQRHQILGRVVSAITSALFWQSLLLFARIRILHNPSVKDFMKKLIWVNFYFPVFPCFFQKKNAAIYFQQGWVYTTFDFCDSQPLDDRRHTVYICDSLSLFFQQKIKYQT